MARSAAFDSLNRRLAVYGYLAPLVAGKRVLEIGDAGGAATASTTTDRLRALGAAKVTTVATFDGRRPEAPGAYDLVLVPDAAGMLAGKGAPALAALQALLGPRGRLVLVAGNGDRPQASGGVGFYELSEALEPLFPRVRMFGLTPFAAFGLAEFEETAPGLRVDAGLVDDANEQPTHYLAVAGPDESVELGYALVQVPLGAGVELPAVAAPAPAAATGASPADVAELRRRLAEAEGQVDGAVRVSRAQVEEIEELRARLRRAAEARAELDQEVARLRRALTEADESVVSLTRKTTEEMTTLAQRLTAGLRQASASTGEAATDKDAGTARLREELRRKEAELAARESALSDRDERVAALEAEKQDLSWRLEAAEEATREARRAAEQAARTPAPAPAPVRAPAAPAEEEVRVHEARRDQALGQYRQAAVAHVEEVSRLREALAEQATLVAELEEALAAGNKRQTAAEQELARVRQHAAEVEQADRARRSRLAEVEGTLLRLKSQAAQAAKAAPATPPPPAQPSAAEAAARAQAQQKIAELSAQVSALEARLRNAEKDRSEAERQWGDAVERMVGADRPAPPPEAPAVDGPRLEAALTEVSRLREALERSEEQLWETKGQLLLDRERMAVLEHQIATLVPAPSSAPVATVTEAAHQAIVTAVLDELAQLESGLRREVARLDAVERTLEDWRADLAVTEGETVPFSRAE